MLTNCTEAGMVKCSQYFPDQLHAVSKAGSLEVQVGRYLCALHAELSTDRYVKQSLLLPM